MLRPTASQAGREAGQGPMAKKTRNGPRRARRAVAEPSARPQAPQTPQAARRKYLLPVLVFLTCFGAYVGNGDFFYGADQEGNMLFSVHLLKRGSFAVTPPDAPYAFNWHLTRPGEEPRRAEFDAEAYEQGLMRPFSYSHSAATTRYPLTFVNTFGIGAAVAGLPVYAVLDLFTDIETDRWWWWHGGALTASLLTAFTALLIFLSARRFVAPVPAFLIALSFGLGSCAWPVSSQALWQHPVNCFFLALGAFFLLASPERRRWAACCGAALGMAVLCRPPSALAVVCVGAWLLWADRRRVLAFVAGGLPFAVALAAYNAYWFGSPFEFGQTVTSRAIALVLTGSEDIWTGPLLESLPGLFVSPQRGLAFYSPVLLLGFYGMALSWKEPRHRVLVPLQAAAVAMIVVAARWYDWWGGASWGYRSIVDTAPFLALSMIPAIERVVSGRRLRVLFGAALLWSVAVQFVGAWSYNQINWLAQWKGTNDPDKASMWQWQRPQILWHMANFARERAYKHEAMQQYVDDKVPLVYRSPRK